MNVMATITFEQALQAGAASKPKAFSAVDTMFRLALASSVAAVIYYVVTNLIL